MSSQRNSSPIEIMGLTKSFGDTTVLNRIDLSVPRGSVYALLGRNGAGKSTTLRLLLGLLQADHGEIRMLGQPMPKARMAILARVGNMIESPSLYPALTARQNLAIDARIRGLGRRAIDRALDIVELADSRKPVRQYSLGMKQRLSLALAVLGAPDILLLDEPTNGLDPSGIADMRRLLRDLPDRLNTTVLLSTHLLGEVEQVATHLCILESGDIRYQGALEDLQVGNDRWLRFESEEIDGLYGWLREREPGRRPVRDRDGIRVAVSSRADAGALIRGVVENGFAVHHASLERRGLEDLYFDLIGATSALRPREEG